MESEEESVQLGFAGDVVEDTSKLQWRDSYVGGSPAWIPDKAPSRDILKCGCCGDDLRLLVQMKADSGVVERTLYVMACVRGSCQSGHGSWKVLRCQQKWRDDSQQCTSIAPITSQEACEQEAVEGQGHGQCMDQGHQHTQANWVQEKKKARKVESKEAGQAQKGNCGSVSKSNESKGGEGVVLATEDWGCDQSGVWDDPIKNKKHANPYVEDKGRAAADAPEDKGRAAADAPEDKGRAAADEDNEDKGMWGGGEEWGVEQVSGGGQEAAADEAVMAGMNDLEQRLSKLMQHQAQKAGHVNGVDATLDGQDGSEKSAKRKKSKAKKGAGGGALNVCAAEFEPCMPPLFVAPAGAAARKTEQTQGGADGKVFTCMHLWSDWEPDKKVPIEAQAIEGPTISVGDAVGAGDWGGESYESTKGDKVFRKFTKRVARAPTQVSRYAWGGTPLWQSKDGGPTEDWPPPCERCGSRRVFEMQVMPALLYILDVEALAPPGDPGLDCGVAVVACCERSCGEQGDAEGEGCMYEAIFVQRDLVM